MLEDNFQTELQVERFARSDARSSVPLSDGVGGDSEGLPLVLLGGARLTRLNRLNISMRN